MLLTLDRGNSTLDACLWGGSATDRRPLRRRRFAVAQGEGPDVLAAWLAGDGPGLAAIGATVVPGGLELVSVALARWGVECWQLRPADAPIAIDYATPESLGIDRVLACAGAMTLAPPPLVVVDCGTATTVNVVDADGRFVGGAIGPGLDGLIAAMARTTPFLPPVDPAFLEPLPARTSAGSVAGGALVGWAGLVDRLVDECAPSDAVRFATGGRAEAWARASRAPARMTPDLVHRGLVRAWEVRCGS